MANLNRNSTPFTNDEDGSATPLAIGFCIIFIVLGGLAVDYNKAVGERTQMQMAADSAAHAALYTWEFEDVPTSLMTAQTAITGMLPDVAFRDALKDTDYAFGYWDWDKMTFTKDENFVDYDDDDEFSSAVQVWTELEPSRSNQSRNIFLSIVGQDKFTIRASSTYAHWYPACFTEGFVSDDPVNMQSNSLYLDGFCIHSNEYVSLNQNNYFESGTVVSMPNLADLDIPESGFEKNEGLQAALRTSMYPLRILRQLPMMFASLRAGKAEYASVASITEDDEVIYPINMSSNGNSGRGVTEEQILAAMEPDADPSLEEALPRYTKTDTARKTLNPINFLPANRIYQLDCSSLTDLTLAPGVYSDFALVTNCPVNLSNGVILDGVLIASEGDVSASLAQLGLDDNCAEGGGAAIWTYGNFSAANGLQGYGAQILAHGTIDFTAQAGGIEGVSFISYGMIDGTSEGEMGYCNGGGMSAFPKAPLFIAVN